MPKKLCSHGMVKIDTDLVVVGGDSPGVGFSSSLYQLTCHNHDCEWLTMSQELKNPRANFVLMTVPNESVDCHTIIPTTTTAPTTSKDSPSTQMSTTTSIKINTLIGSKYNVYVLRTVQYNHQSRV